MGRAFAKCLEHGSADASEYFKRKPDDGPLTIEEANARDEQQVQVEELVRGYFNHYGPTDRNGLTTEVAFDSLVLGRGQLDGVVEMGDWGRAGREDKLFNRNFFRYPHEAAQFFDGQMTAYFAAMQEAGTPLDYMERRITLKPTINRRQKRQPETLEEYRLRLRADIAGDPEKYYRSFRLVRSQEQIWEYLAGVGMIGKQMDLSAKYAKKLENKKAAYPQNTTACSMFGECKFLALCKDGELALPKYRVKPKLPKLNELQQKVVKALADSFLPLNLIPDVAKRAGVDGRAAANAMHALSRKGVVHCDAVGPNLIGWGLTEIGEKVA